MSDDELPPIDTDLDKLYVTTNWLIEKRKSPTLDPQLIRNKFLNRFREQTNSCRNHHNNPESKTLQGHFNIPYGDNPEQGATKPDRSGEDAFDWFGPAKLAPNQELTVVVYIHGGYWQALELTEASHWATPVTDANAIFVTLGFRLAPWQHIKSMPSSLCKGMEKVYEFTLDQLGLTRSPSVGTDSTPQMKICLVGHSAGVQLALEMLQTASQLQAQTPDWFHAVKYLVLMSGVYDLRPLVHTSINRALKLRTAEEAWGLSPLRNFTDSLPAWLTKQPLHWLITWAEFDSPALIEQSRIMVDHLRKSIGPKTESLIETFEVHGTDHITSIDQMFYGPDHSQLLRKILEFVGLIR